MRRWLLATEGVLIALLVAGACLADDAPRQSPILITFDCHMDPLHSFRDLNLRRRIFREWVDAGNWLLDVADRHGAKITFLSVGEFMEFCLEEPDYAFPLLRRMYESGGSVSTHTHREYRVGPHRWREAGNDQDEATVRRVWDDAVGLVDEALRRALGVTDPAEVRKINCLRGTHTPSDLGDYLKMLGEYGFAGIQAGPGEDFAGLFGHYMFHPHRPAADNALAHDEDSPAVLTMAGPVLGATAVHKGVPQDMSLPRVKALFLMEVLNWLRAARTGAPDRVWCLGWAVHGSDIVPERGVSRPWVEPMLGWLDQCFVGKRIGGERIARYASYVDEVRAYERWEKRYPEAPRDSYGEVVRDWGKYPYLPAMATYLWDARYVTALGAPEGAQIHRLIAPPALGGPFDVLVAFTTGEEEQTADVAFLGTRGWAVIDPATGERQGALAHELPIPPAGAIYWPEERYAGMDEVQRAIDAVYPRELPASARPRKGDLIADFDRDGDSKVSRAEFPAPAEVFDRLDANRDGFLDAGEAAAAPAPRRP